MRGAFHTAAWQTNAAQTVAALPDVAAGRQGKDVIENFWQQDKKPEEARAAFVRFAFREVCTKNDQPSAAWLLEHYSAHLKIADMKKAAIGAFTNGHDALADFLAGAIQRRGDTREANRALEILLGEALEKATPEAVAGLLQKMPEKMPEKMSESGSTYLYRAALGGQEKNAACLIRFCKSREILLQEDLDRALVVAIKNENIPMVQAFLDDGADPDACRKASMTRAAQTNDAVRGVLLEMLLLAGADPLHAQEKFPESYKTDIQKTAAAVQEKHRTILQQQTGGALNIESLRGFNENLGMTGLHYAARHRLLKDIPLQGLTAQDLLQTNAQGQNLVEAMVQAGDATSLLAADKWRGKRDVLIRFVALLPEKMQENIALPALLHDVDMQTLKARQHGLRLKPKGF